VKALSFISFRRSLMNPHRGIDNNNNNKENKTRSKAIAVAAIAMTGIIFAASVVSGLSLFSTYTQPAIAQQQNSTGTSGTAAGVESGGSPESSPCVPTRTRGEITTSRGDNATTIGTTNSTGNNATAGEAESQPPTLSVIGRIEQACKAIQAGSTEDALYQLESAIRELRGNMQGNTTTTSGNPTETTENTTTGGETTTGGGTVGSGGAGGAGTAGGIITGGGTTIGGSTNTTSTSATGIMNPAR
jgi:hypothetical protein